MATRYRNGRPRAKTHAPGFVALSVVVALLFVAAVGVIGLVKLCDEWLSDLPDSADAVSYSIAAPSQVYSADGVLLAEFSNEYRIATTIDKISPYVLHGTVDTEDIRFYEHNGVDVQGIGRAIVAQLTGRNEGASTITQQYVRNTLLLDEMSDMTIRRKVREAYLALELEKVYSKDEILTMYLNTINYGDGAYGIEAASQHYFSKSAADLSLAEAALLVGIPQSPSNLNPVYHPDDARARRDVVLDRMLTAGDITQEEHDEAAAEDVALSLQDVSTGGIYQYPYFVNYVQSQLSENFSESEIFRGGLTIETTLDTRVQQAAEDACNEHLEGQPSSLEYSLTSIDPSNGHVVAMVGGKDFDTNQFNLATQARRQAGSSFKTFALVTAISEGISPSTTIDSSSPAYINGWTVRNSEGTGRGKMTLAEATFASVNTVYARLAHAMGAQPIVDTAQAMGITSPLEAVESIALGTQGVCTLEMADAYATLAANGTHHQPSVITKVTNNRGEVVYEEDTTGDAAIDSEVAAVTTEVLQGVVTSGTGYRARLSSGQPVAGKTGTSEDCRDNWFCGYTPQLATAVWLGSREESTIRYNGANGYGGTTCAPVWRDFTAEALDLMGATVTDFEEPQGTIQYDPDRWSSSGFGSSSRSSRSSRPTDFTGDTGNASDSTGQTSQGGSRSGSGGGSGSSSGGRSRAGGGSGSSGGDSSSGDGADDSGSSTADSGGDSGGDSGDSGGDSSGGAAAGGESGPGGDDSGGE